MRIIGAICLVFVLLCNFASAQSSTPGPTKDSPHSTGRTVLPPEMKGVDQPQGKTGPLEMRFGGAPASSPQGQTPPGMQAAPEGSDKTIVDPRSDTQRGRLLSPN